MAKKPNKKQRKEKKKKKKGLRCLCCCLLYWRSSIKKIKAPTDLVFVDVHISFVQRRCIDIDSRPNPWWPLICNGKHFVCNLLFTSILSFHLPSWHTSGSQLVTISLSLLNNLLATYKDSIGMAQANYNRAHSIDCTYKKKQKWLWDNVTHRSIVIVFLMFTKIFLSLAKGYYKSRLTSNYLTIKTVLCKYTNWDFILQTRWWA